VPSRNLSRPRSRSEAEKRLLIALAAGSALINLVSLTWSGIRHGADSVRYVEGAANLLAGRPLAGMQMLFPGYAGLLAVSTALGLGERGVILFQLALAAVATIVLYEIARQLSGPIAGGVAAAFFALNVDIVRWHSYLLTDSIYISLVVLAVYAINRAAERGGWWYPAGVFVVVAAGSMRPHGRVLGMLTAIYWLVHRPTVREGRWIGVTCAALLFAGAVLTSQAALGEEVETPSQWLHDGVVVWADPGARLAMPPGQSSPVRYGLQHPWATARLAAARVGMELLHARPFYSRGHNVAVVGLLAFTYAFATAGFRRTRREPLALLILAVIALHFLIVAVTFADWDGRFLLYVLPLINVFAAVELAARFPHAFNRVA
jgi:4-amino-4-deoxy-L-arabinose transferase-like glycosyltransferase